MTINTTRRQLLQSAVATGIGALSGMSMIRGASAAAMPTTLVVVHLEGGNDTLNTVIPYANSEYYRLRGTMAIPVADSLKLDGANAFHPALVGLKSLWDRSRIAIVHGVGYPNFNYSHFQSKQAYWGADPTLTTRTGWLGRAVDEMAVVNPNIDILSAVTLASETRPLSGQRSIPVQVPYDLKQFYLGTSDAQQVAALKQLMSLPATTTSTLRNRVLLNSQTALRAYEKVKVAAGNTSSVAYPYGGISYHLRAAAQLMRSDPDIRVITVYQSGFDHHANLLPNHRAQLVLLDAALKAFTDDLDSTGMSGRVLILLTSDFGRRVFPNGQAGADHGAAQAMMLIGPGVRPGVVGTAPLLTDASMINNGNLPMQFDFRQVYSTVLSGWLGVNAKNVLGGVDYPVLPLLF